MKASREGIDRTAGWLYILTAYGTALAALSLSVTDGSNAAMGGFALVTVGCVLRGRSLIRKGRA